MNTVRGARDRARDRPTDGDSEMGLVHWPFLLIILLLLPSVEPRRLQKRKLLAKRHSAALEQGTTLYNQQRWAEAAHAYQARLSLPLSLPLPLP